MEAPAAPADSEAQPQAAAGADEPGWLPSGSRHSRHRSGSAGGGSTGGLAVALATAEAQAAPEAAHVSAADLQLRRCGLPAASPPKATAGGAARAPDKLQQLREGIEQVRGVWL